MDGPLRGPFFYAIQNLDKPNAPNVPYQIDTARETLVKSMPRMRFATIQQRAITSFKHGFISGMQLNNADVMGNPCSMRHSPAPLLCQAPENAGL